jgi:hypothetical protein
MLAVALGGCVDSNISSPDAEAGTSLLSRAASVIAWDSVTIATGTPPECDPETSILACPGEEFEYRLCEDPSCGVGGAEVPCPPSIGGNTHLYLRAPGRTVPIGPFTFRGPHQNQSFASDPGSSTGIWRPYAIDPFTVTSDSTVWMARGVFIAVCEKEMPHKARIRPLLKADGSAEFTGEVWRVFQD